MTDTDPAFPAPALLCDIGGTNCRFALMRAPDSPLEQLDAVATRAHATFAAGRARGGAGA